MKPIRRSERRKQVRGPRRPIELGVERCEERRLMTGPATFTVQNTNPGGTGSLAEAISSANTVVGGSSITFAAGVSGTIALSGPLPTILASTTIQGTTQNGVPNIAISGGGAPSDAIVLGPGSGGSAIEGLAIVGFGGAAIRVQSSGDRIAGDDLGVTTAGGNGADGEGILLDGASGATIGGTSAASANVIGFNTSAGVSISGAGSTGDLVVGNFIGTNAAGADLSNAIGVALSGATSATIGGTAAGAANAIGPNTLANVAVLSGSGDVVGRNLFRGSNDGPNPPASTFDIRLAPGANGGIAPPALSYASLSSDGLTLALGLAAPAGASEVIDVYLSTTGAGSTPAQRTFLGEAVVASGASVATIALPSTPAAGSQVVATSTIAADGTSESSGPIAVQPATTVTNTNDSGIGSLRYAIAAATAGHNTIGFAISGAGPFTIGLSSSISMTVPVVIDGTTELSAQGTPLVEVSGGGTIADGLVLASGSGGSAVEGLQFGGFTGADIVVQSPNDTIGGATARAGDVFSTADGAGVLIEASGAVVSASDFGTDAAGDDLAGTGIGIGVISGSATIGGTTPASGNLVMTGGTGVSISGGTALVEGNLIGTRGTGGTAGVAVGVDVTGGLATIGGATAGASNDLGFTGEGVILAGGTSIVEGDLIGTDAAGDSLGGTAAVWITGGGNTVGGTVGGSGNVLAFSKAGVSISGANNLVEGNFLGTNASGLAAGNSIGVALAGSSATGDVIGGGGPGTANTFGFSSAAAVSISGGATGDAVRGNEIGTDQAGDNLAASPAGAGIVIDRSPGNTVGGASAGQGNTIAFSSVGVSIYGSSSTGELVQGNFIGTNAAGADLGNTLGVVLDGAPNNTIGGTIAGAGNTIAFHQSTSTEGALTVRNAVGDAILGDLVYGNAVTAATAATSGIYLSAGNDGLAAPVVTSVKPAGPSSTTVTLDVSGMAAGTYTLDLFAGEPGDTPSSGQVDARIALGAITGVVIHPGQTSLNETVPQALSGGQLVIGTWTVESVSGLTAGDTSEFSTPITPPRTFTVTTTAATGAGSLGDAIQQVNADTTNPNADAIQFDIPQSQAVGGVWTIALSGQSLLPTIAHPVIIAGASQPGYAGSPVIVVVGIPGSPALDLGAGSDGSTIRALAVEGAGTGILVESGGDTIQSDLIGTGGRGNGVGISVTGASASIGGTSPGVGNTITYNTGDGVDAVAGTLVEGNLIYANGGAALSTASTVAPPTLGLAVSSNGTTTISGTPSTSGTFDFYATSGSLGPAAIYLGSATSFPATLPATVPVGASIVATTTANGDTSPFSAPTTVSNPFVVTSLADSGNGSLRQVLEAASSYTGSVTVTFALTGQGPYLIDLASGPLPAIGFPIVLDASSLAPGLTVDGSNLGASGTYGLDLAPGSNGSVVEGIRFQGFAGPGILVESTGVSIGGTAAGAGDVLTADGSGVSITGGGGAVIRGDLIYANAGAAISYSGVTPPASPTITAVSSVANLTAIDYQVSGNSGDTYAVDFYASGTAGGPAAEYLGSATVTLSGSTGAFTAELPIATALGASQVVTATITEVSGGSPAGTSTFATMTALPVASPYLVTQTTDDLPGSMVGSLRQAILNADAAGAGTTTAIAFSSSLSPPTIAVSSVLPTISVPVSILGLAGTAPASITGGGGRFDGLILGAGSEGSTVADLAITGFGGAGLRIESGGASVVSSFFGSDGSGILLDGAPGATIGGTASGTGDTIAGNTAAGVSITGASASANALYGDSITSNAVGVLISGGASNNTIGGTAAGAANTIGNSTTSNILILSGSGNLVVADLFQGGSPASSPGYDISVASGANGGIAAPVLTYASLSSSGLTLDLGLAAPAAAASTYDVYLSIPAAGSTPAQRTFLGEASVAQGSSVVEVALASSSSIPAGAMISATATVPSDGTSAFSAPLGAYGSTTVTNTNDGGIGSLRYAIAAATAGDNTIRFAIASGPFVIGLLSPISASVPVVVDGTTQESTPGVPLVAISGGGSVFDGLVLAPGSDGSKVQGLQFQGFQGADLVVESSNDTIGGASASADVFSADSGFGVSISGGGVLVAGDDFGVDASGNTIGGGTGIVIGGGSATIGGSASGAGNTIASTSFQAGVSVLGGAAVIEGNLIGVDASGNSIGGGTGIVLAGTGSTIGGSLSGQGNTIAYEGTGILIAAGASGNLVAGNFLGTNASQSQVGNAIGIAIDDQPVTEGNGLADAGNTIGGAASGLANTIGFNGTGVSISGASTTGNLVAGNFIGTDGNGAKLGNGVGIAIVGASGNTIGVGASLSGAGNTIGFDGTGVSISGSLTSGNLVAGNFVGTDGNGAKLGNGANSGGNAAPSGIVLSGDAGNTIGPGNVVGDNAGGGILLRGSTGDSVLGNDIGTDASGRLLGNSGDGIEVLGGSGNTIGGATATGAGANIIADNSGDGIGITLTGTVASPDFVRGNVVSLNSQNGVHFSGDLTQGTTLVEIAGNLVGTTSDGGSVVNGLGIRQGNGLDGIRLDQSAPAISGSGGGIAAVVMGNVSSGNGLSGVDVETATTGGAFASLARVLIEGNDLGTNAGGQAVSAASSVIAQGDSPQGTTGGVAVPFGNALDGVLLNEVVGVTVGGAAGNIISGNLGRGVEVRTDALGGLGGAPYSSDLIQGNTIGLGGPGTLPTDADGTSFGNLSDGIFLYEPGAGPTSVRIAGNTVSNNQGAGIHAVAGPVVSAGGLVIAGNRIGTDPAGLLSGTVGGTTGSFLGFGNGSDGVFLVGFPSGGGAALASISGNVISANHANGVDLLDSQGVVLSGNRIGTDILGISAIGGSTTDLGNAADGVFVNQSDQVTIGGTSAVDRNTISGNHASGVFISGTSTVPSGSNLVEGNWIGIGVNGSRGTVATPNAVAGVILSNADANVVGGTAPGSGNVISGNSLDGVLLVNQATDNVIAGNLIGTDPAGGLALGNSADGIFLLGSTSVTIKGVANTNPTISGNAIVGNVISGNDQNGVQVFGGMADSNAIAGNLIGLSPRGQALGNGAAGVLLNGAGPANVVGGASAADRNIISGNSQAGVEITNGTTGSLVEGDNIGTDASGRRAVRNGSAGVLIYGSSFNTIGGATASPGTGAGDLISGNAQAGVQIFSPGGAQTAGNVVIGDLIGTDATGASALPNGSDGVQIQNADGNAIGGPLASDRNVISGNAGNGVLIDQLTVSTASNRVLGDRIGTNAEGTAAVPNGGSGVELIDGSANTIGGISGGATLGASEAPNGPGPGGSPGNLISGNLQWGVLFALSGASAGQVQSTVEGNWIGLNAPGTAAIGNGQGGVFVEDVTSTYLPQTIGGSVAGAGNFITGNANVGVQLVGAQAAGPGPGGGDVVEGNVIGLGTSGQVMASGSGATGDGTGVLIQNAPGAVIGGTSAADRNIISGNSQSGVQIFDVLSTGDLVLNNFIGTGPDGAGFPIGSSEASPAQSVGVLVNGSSGDAIGMVGVGNVISGNAVGVEIAGIRQNNGQVSGSGNSVAGNLIGTDASGTRPVGNLDVGVFVDDSSGNVVGPGNVASANGIAGVEIFGANASGNLVAGNTIGTGAGGRVFSASGEPVLSSSSPEAGIPVYAQAQLNGVVILGASGNTIGLDRRLAGSEGNVVDGNVQVGVYVTSRDFQGNGYTAPVGNVVSGNTIRGDGQYGVLLYDAPRNAVPPFASRSASLERNGYGSESIGFRNYQGGFDGATPLPLQHRTARRSARGAHARHVRAPLHRHPAGPLHALRRDGARSHAAILLDSRASSSPENPGPIAIGALGGPDQPPTAGGGVNGVARRVRPK